MQENQNKLMDRIIYEQHNYVKYLLNEVEKGFSLQGPNISTDRSYAGISLANWFKTKIYHNWYTKNANRIEIPNEVKDTHCCEEFSVTCYVEFEKKDMYLTKYSHCVKIIRIRSFSGLYFPAFELNTERYSVSVRIKYEWGKIRARKTPNTDTFHAVSVKTKSAGRKNIFMLSMYVHACSFSWMFKVNKETLEQSVKYVQS